MEDKTYLFDALGILAQVQMEQGNFNAAADSLNRAFALPGIEDDLLFYRYLDRSGVYQRLAEKCDYQRNFDACFQALNRRREDLTKALGIAQKLGWAGLAKEMEGRLRDADVRAMLIGKQKDSHESFATAKDNAFDPKKPSDVLVSERFVGEGFAIPPEMDLYFEQSKRFEAQAGGFANSGAVTSLYTDGLRQQQKGDHAGALSSFMKGIAMLEQDRGRLQDDKGTFVESKIRIYYEAILELLAKRRYDEAFELMERSRGRAMADMLASRPLSLSGTGEQQLYTELVGLRTAIAAKQADLFRLINAAAKPDALAPVDREIAALEDVHRKLAARISAEAPRLHALTTSRAVSLRELQERMRQDDFEVLEYLVTETAVILGTLMPAVCACATCSSRDPTCSPRSQRCRRACRTVTMPSTTRPLARCTSF